MEINQRKEELEEIIKKYGSETGDILKKLIEDVIFLEEKMEELKKLPFLKVDENNKQRQKATPAAKQYKEFLQQYSNVIKMLLSITKKSDEDEESPLRKWAKKYLEAGNEDSCENQCKNQ